MPGRNPLFGRNIGEHVTLGVIDAAHYASCFCDVQHTIPDQITLWNDFFSSLLMFHIPAAYNQLSWIQSERFYEHWLFSFGRFHSAKTMKEGSQNDSPVVTLCYSLSEGQKAGVFQNTSPFRPHIPLLSWYSVRCRYRSKPAQDVNTDTTITDALWQLAER